jgi:glycosyltransferase involved in cell wall biosynthesis
MRATHGSDPRIAFVGFHPKPVEIIQTADVFVFPSLYDNLPTVIIEALYCGVPVISTATAEIPAMLATRSGELCGQLIEIAPIETLADRLAEAMDRYVHDPDLRRRHGELTGAAFEKFDMTVCARHYQSFYRSVCAS